MLMWKGKTFIITTITVDIYTQQPYNPSLENLSTAHRCRDTNQHLSRQVHTVSSKSSSTGRQCHEALCLEQSVVTNSLSPTLPLLFVSYYSLFPMPSSSPENSKNSSLFFALSHLCVLITRRFSLFSSSFQQSLILDPLLLSDVLCSGFTLSICK